MSDKPLNSPDEMSAGYLPDGEALRENVAKRQRRGIFYRLMLFAAIAISILALVTLMINIVSGATGLVAAQYRTDPDELTGGRPLEEFTQPELVTLLEENLRSRVLRNLEREQPLVERDQENLVQIVNDELIQEEIVATYRLIPSILNGDQIRAEVAEKFPRAEVRWKVWLSPEFLVVPMSSTPANAGVRTAILGSLWVIFITMLVAIPLGVGAAIYLEEYATDTPINRIIQTNINNLAGVPSIIYGMLGLAIFVRALEPITSGTAFGLADPTTANGRTVLSAGLTMALLILPIIIIASQEAIRAVPSSLRQASYGLGATKWQTVRDIVLPNAFPGILTGTILAMSRAVGETAPLIVIGASTFIVTDPNGPFSKFTVLPIQIYTWTARPQDDFRNIAAAAIIVLLIILLSLNATAVLLRNYLRSKRVS